MNTSLGSDCHWSTLWHVSAPEAVTISRETRKVLISWGQFTCSPSELGWKSEGWLVSQVRTSSPEGAEEMLTAKTAGVHHRERGLV